MKKLVSLLLALIMILSMVPMFALATETEEKEDEKKPHWSEFGSISKNEKGELVGTDKNGNSVVLPADVAADYLAYLDSKGKNPFHKPGKHNYGWASNLKYHWLQCPCGCKIDMEPHIDPLESAYDTCFCGYHFSDNADLVVLWIQGAYPIKNFSKDVTEYEIKGHTYKEFNDVMITARPFQSGATIELPEDRDIKEGKNVFEIKVISENKKVTKTYTVTINKESK